MLSPYEVYTKYLALKMHFTKPKYDFFKYSGKVKANIDSFYKRKDTYFFEKMSRKKNEEEVINFFVSNFINSTDPSKMWIGELRSGGEKIYIAWKSKLQSLSYRFKEDLSILTEDSHLFESLNSKTNSHPKIIKYYLANKVCIETLVILDDITGFATKISNSSKKDPIFNDLYTKIIKYKPFLKYNKKDYINQIKNYINS